MIREITENNWRDQIDELGKSVKEATFLTAITGAGISLASGLPLIDDNCGEILVRDLFRRQSWYDEPETYFNAYREILQTWRIAKPNRAHEVLGQSDAWVITQNVDGLHRDAATQHLLEIHGNLRELRCECCETIYGTQFLEQVAIPRCPNCNEILRPGFTFEGEEIRHFSLATDWCGRADVLLIVGTDLAMKPIKQLPEIARKRTDCLLIVINYLSELVLPSLFEYRTKLKIAQK